MSIRCLLGAGWIGRAQTAHGALSSATASTPQIHRFAGGTRGVGLVLQETLKLRLRAMSALRDVFERAGEVERPQLTLEAKHLTIARVEKDHGRCVGDARVTGPDARARAGAVGPCQLGAIVEREAHDVETRELRAHLRTLKALGMHLVARAAVARLE